MDCGARCGVAQACIYSWQCTPDLLPARGLVLPSMLATIVQRLRRDCIAQCVPWAHWATKHPVVFQRKGSAECLVQISASSRFRCPNAGVAVVVDMMTWAVVTWVAATEQTYSRTQPLPATLG